MRAVLCLASLLLAVVPAAASGGFSCTGDDQNAKFEVRAGVTTGMGGPTFNFEGEVDIAAKGVPEDLRKTAFKDENLAQYWLDDKELRIVAYREREGDKPHGYVMLTVRTQVSEESVYGGQYEMSVFDVGGGAEGTTVKFDGTVSCFVE